MTNYSTRFMSMDEYRSLPETTRAELINNVLHEPPSPAYSHQDILFEIAHQLRLYTRHDATRGTMVIAPFDVYLDKISNAVQPDIILLLPDNPGLLEVHFHGVPDLIVEILSPGNRNHDRKTKLGLYEKFGVKEYWIVDPRTHLVYGYTLSRRRFKHLTPQKGRIESRLLNLTIAF